MTHAEKRVLAAIRDGFTRAATIAPQVWQGMPGAEGRMRAFLERMQRRGIVDCEGGEWFVVTEEKTSE